MISKKATIIRPAILMNIIWPVDFRNSKIASKKTGIGSDEAIKLKTFP